MKKIISLVLAAILVFGTIPAVSANEAGLQLGVVNGSNYVNETLNLSCKLGEGWSFLDQDQILELMGYTGEVLGEEYQKFLETAETYMDAYAYNLDTGDTVNITVEKLNPLNAVIMTEEKYVEASRDTLVTALIQMGMEKIVFSSDTGKIGGQEHCIITIQGELNGEPLVETMGIIKNRNLIIVITCAGPTENLPEEVFGAVRFLDAK